MTDSLGGKRGYCGIGIYQPQHDTNVGTLWRSAFCLQADFIFTIGNRVVHQATDTTKAWRHIPFYQYQTIEDLLTHLPYSCRLIGVEIAPNARNLASYVHPERACYLLGREDTGLPATVMGCCHALIKLDSRQCLNVAVAGSIVLYDRQTKGGQRHDD